MGRLGSDAQNASDVPEERQGQGVPGGPVVKNLPRSPGDTGLILVQEDPTCLRAAKPTQHNHSAYMLQPLKAVCLEPMLCNKRSRHRGACALQRERRPTHCDQRGPGAAAKTQHSQKYIDKNLNIKK